MINNKKQSDYCVHKWRYADYKKFKTVGDIKVGLTKLINLSDKLELVVGYIEPGHGATVTSLICTSCIRGKKR